MEMEFFVKPGDGRGVAPVLDRRAHRNWYVDLGIDPENLRHYEHPQGEALATTPSAPSTSSTASSFDGTEWGELEGIANRTDFDLKTHSKHSGQDLSYFDQASRRALDAVRHRAGGRPVAAR